MDNDAGGIHHRWQRLLWTRKERKYHILYWNWRVLFDVMFVNLGSSCYVMPLRSSCIPSSKTLKWSKVDQDIFSASPFLMTNWPATWRLKAELLICRGPLVFLKRCRLKRGACCGWLSIKHGSCKVDATRSINSSSRLPPLFHLHQPSTKTPQLFLTPTWLLFLDVFDLHKTLHFEFPKPTILQASKAQFSSCIRRFHHQYVRLQTRYVFTNCSIISSRTT